MIHQFQDKKRIIKRKKTVKTLIGFGVFIILCSLGLLVYTGKIFNKIGLPIWNTEKILTDTASDLGYLVRTKSSVYKENENLLQENKTFSFTSNDISTTGDVRAQLRNKMGAMFGFEQPTISNNGVPLVVDKTNENPFANFIVDAAMNMTAQDKAGLNNLG